MKKHYFLGLILLGSFCSAQYSAFAGTGNVNGSEGWASHSGTANQIQKLATASDVGNSLSYADLEASTGNRTFISDANSEDINLAFSAAATTTAYASFLLKVTDVSNMQPNTYGFAPSYFAHFAPTSGTSVSTFVSRLSIRQGSVANTFNLGIVNTTGGTIPLSEIFPASPQDYAVGTTYLVVLKYDMTGTSGKTSLFVNPVINGTEPAAIISSSAGTSTKLASVLSFCLREASKIGSMEIDEVRVGSTWASVTPAYLAVSDLSATKKSLISNTLVKDNFKMLTSGSADLQIYSATGALVRTLQTKSNEVININNLPKGMYILKIVTDGKLSTEKIIKE
ncbi:T9SS type A sorting domain-containing protein [Halpernia humi]|nr:T9SS type A sorting domain-containing protein [Halpernia humi]